MGEIILGEMGLGEMGQNQVDIKLLMLVNSKSMFTMCNAALTQVEILRLRAATELNNDGTMKLGDVHYQREPNLSIFPNQQ